MNAVEGTWAGPIVVGHDPGAGQALILADSTATSGTSSRRRRTSTASSCTGSRPAASSFSRSARTCATGPAPLGRQDGSPGRGSPAEVDVRFRDVDWGGNGFTLAGSRDAGGQRFPVVFTVVTCLQESGVTDAPFSELATVGFSGTGGIAVGATTGGARSSSSPTPRRPGLAWRIHRAVRRRRAWATSSSAARRLRVLVAGGWTGTGAVAPDALVMIWTTAAGSARSFETVVPGPFDISTDFVVIASGVAVATGTAPLIPFPGPSSTARWRRTLTRWGPGSGGSDGGRRLRRGPVTVVATAAPLDRRGPVLRLRPHALSTHPGLDAPRCGSCSGSSLASLT